ncbi:hypothetical protein [Vibrio variabilis]|uniref:hypothetical protein n=1 Tax=Vibrio variabilis TaxID=990271 RepID=UPI0023B81B28|nr:hypothetical protein [Vibrio variabilis]
MLDSILDKVTTSKVGQQYVQGVRELFPGAIQNEEWQTSNQVTITVKMTALVDVMKWLYYEQGAG